MVARLIGSPEARKDLLEIYIAIGLDNPAAAERLYTTIEAKADRLRRHPRLGPRRPDIRAAARLLVEGPYLILFETRPDTDEGPVDTVEILRVVDGRRDLTNLV
ncbi:MAG: type II toxin-antitoxin system RelE/ParE family toxin [Roseiarcus sp.]